jgi:hypothetical protein
VDGTVNRRGERFVLQVRPDMPPDVQLAKRLAGPRVTPEAAIPFALQAEDDCGISGASMWLLRKGLPPVTEDVPGLPDERKVQAEHVLDLRPQKPNPGETVTVYAEVCDNMPEEFMAFGSSGDANARHGPNSASSARLEFRIVRPEDLMDDLVRRQKELRIEFSEAIGVQEEASAKTARAAEEARAGQISAQIQLLLTESARLQGAVATECSRASDILTGILGEMRCNRLGHPEDYTQIMQDVIVPLNGLAAPIQQAIAGLNEAAAIGDSQTITRRAAELADAQKEIRARMSEILQRMVKIGSRQELEKEVLKLIERSTKLLQGIVELRERTTETIFDPATPSGEGKEKVDDE